MTDHAHHYPVFTGVVTNVSLEYTGYGQNRQPHSFAITAKTEGSTEDYELREKQYQMRLQAPLTSPPPAVGSTLTVSYQAHNVLGVPLDKALPVGTVEILNDEEDDSGE